ncbi:exonuclease [Xanthomonas phage f30-Xaj]|uniref:Exonuclease n=1 Tax=Xanthomonas phage f30-Xaj TaxID=1784981 RepID=A0A127AWY3_9CAUD|nr:DNA polymerase exonuclease subunit [Xanthomonas phage f30-Xaj]AMM44734.1 exonuclease [Xanthomonas phage f30-Xaj]
MKRIKRPKLRDSEVTYDLATVMDATPTSGPKILIADIETSMMLGWFFSTFKTNISLDAIKQDWNILSFSAKWAGDSPTLYQSLRHQRNPINDFSLCKSLHVMLCEADIVIAHNGKKFDMRKIRARMAHNRMPPIPDVRVIDTLLESRKQFGFTSQKLIYLSEKFGPDGMRKNEHGAFPGVKLWVGCQTGNQEAWDEMESYNVPDVLALEGVWEELRPWYQGAQNLAVFNETHDGHTCPNCGSTDVRRKGTRYTQVGHYARYQCNGCGGWSRGRVLLTSRQERAHILIN